MEQPKDNVCAIWGTHAQTSRSSSFIWHYDSVRAGGGYSIDLLAWHRLPTNDVVFRSKLTTWIINQHRNGDPYPSVTVDIIQEIVSKRPLRLTDRITRFYSWIDSISLRPGDSISITHDSAEQLGELAAWTECHSESEAIDFLNLLKSSGILNPTTDMGLTLEGWKNLEASLTKNGHGNQAFVAMWFSDETSKAYAQGITPALEKAGYTPIRIDQKEHNNKIDDEIVAEIRKSRFVIADFTCGISGDGDDRQTIPRGGVYYEAGFAQGLGLPVIWTVRSDQIGDVHFDTRQYNHIMWDTPEDLEKKLYNRIGAVIGIRNPT